MGIWLVRIVTLVWAGFWLCFGVGWALAEHLAWTGVLLSTLRPGGLFIAIALIGWRWPRPGGVLLVLTGFVLSAWYGISFGHMPTSTKLFVLGTIALPPLAAGLWLLWATPGAGSHAPPRVS